MALAFYDDDDTTPVIYTTDPLRSFHHGQLGSIHEEMINIRNADAGTYYTNVSLAFQVKTYNDFGELGISGWSVKLMYGARRPTEAEWDLIASGATIQLPDIGTTGGADITTYHPVWIRIYSPGGELAQIRDNQQLKLLAFERIVGA